MYMLEAFFVSVVSTCAAVVTGVSAVLFFFGD